MHIEKYRDKKKNGTVSFEFSQSGRIAVLERRFDEHSGLPQLVPTQETDSKDMAATIDHTEQQIAQLTAVLDDQKALAADIAAKEAEADKIRKENEKKK